MPPIQSPEADFAWDTEPSNTQAFNNAVADHIHTLEQNYKTLMMADEERRASGNKYLNLADQKLYPSDFGLKPEDAVTSSTLMLLDYAKDLFKYNSWVVGEADKTVDWADKTADTLYDNLNRPAEQSSAAWEILKRTEQLVITDMNFKLQLSMKRLAENQEQLAGFSKLCHQEHPEIEASDRIIEVSPTQLETIVGNFRDCRDDARDMKLGVKAACEEYGISEDKILPFSWHNLLAIEGDFLKLAGVRGGSDKGDSPSSAPGHSVTEEDDSVAQPNPDAEVNPEPGPDWADLTAEEAEQDLNTPESSQAGLSSAETLVSFLFGNVH